MIKSLSTSVITMFVVYAISFAVFASPQEPEGTSGHLKFYDIPAMLGEKKDITVDLTSPYDVYVTKLYDSVDDVKLEILNCNILVQMNMFNLLLLTKNQMTLMS